MPSPLFDHSALHVPDGDFLDLRVALLCWFASLICLGVAMFRSRQRSAPRAAFLAALLAAFIFVAQMLNFPIAAGTSGHFFGGVLAAAVLGPWSGMLVMAIVVAVQALLFQDGGLIVMGANILNIAIVTVLAGFGIYRTAVARANGSWLATAGIGAWLSVPAAALAVSLELWLSGTVTLGEFLPEMVGAHALVGVGEAVITVAVLAFVARTRPQLLQLESARRSQIWIVVALAVIVVLVALIPLASAAPGGLQRIAADLGLADAGWGTRFAPFPDYMLPGLNNRTTSTVVAGLLGAVVAALITAGSIRLLRTPSGSE